MIDPKYFKLFVSFLLFIGITYSLVGLTSIIFDNFEPIQYMGLSFVILGLYILSLKYLGWKIDIKPIKEKK